MTKPATLADGSLYVRRRDMHPGKGSTLRKLIRGARIAHGLRPLTPPRERAALVGVDAHGVPQLRFFTLHPTKGFRPHAGR